MKYNLSQKEATDRIGISPSIVSGYETGERTPSAENLLALSRLYRCPADYLPGNNNQSVYAMLDVNGLMDAQACALQALINTMKV